MLVTLVSVMISVAAALMIAVMVTGTATVVEVQITVNHIDTIDKSYAHDAAVSWVENVNYDRFTACVMAAGFNERKSNANVTVDWMAYQGAPVGGVAGEVRLSQWWTGTTCKSINFPSVSK